MCLLLHSEERGGVGWNFDKSADKVVDVQITGELSGAQRKSVVDERHHHPRTTDLTTVSK